MATSQRDVYQLPVRKERDFAKRDAELNRILRDIQLRLAEREGRTGEAKVLGNHLVTGYSQLSEITNSGGIRPALDVSGVSYYENNELWAHEYDLAGLQHRRMRLVQRALNNGVILGKASDFNFGTALTATLDRDNDRVDVVLDVGAIDHGGLAGLADDDHTRYFDKDASKAVAGILTPDGDGTRDIGLTGTRFKDLFLGGNLDVGGTSTLDGVVTGQANWTTTGSLVSVDDDDSNPGTFLAELGGNGTEGYLQLYGPHGTDLELVSLSKAAGGIGLLQTTKQGSGTHRPLHIISLDSVHIGTSATPEWEFNGDDLLPTTSLASDIGSTTKRVGSAHAHAYRGIVLAAFGFSAGQYNVGSTDTQLDSYDVTIPANILKVPGDYLEIEGSFVLATNANPKTIRLQIDSTTKRISAQTSVSLASMIVRVVARLLYRTSTTGAWGGVSWIDASAASPIAGQGYLHNAGLTGADWTAAQTLKLWAQGGASNDVRATDYTVTAFVANSGVLV